MCSSLFLFLFSCLFLFLFQACTAIANGMPIVTQLPASWYTHPCHTHNGWVFKIMSFLLVFRRAAGSHIFDNHCDTALRGARAMQVSTPCMHGSHSRSGDVYRITLVTISLLLVSELPTHKAPAFISRLGQVQLPLGQRCHCNLLRGTLGA